MSGSHDCPVCRGACLCVCVYNNQKGQYVADSWWWHEEKCRYKWREKGKNERARDPMSMKPDLAVA